MALWFFMIFSTYFRSNGKYKEVIDAKLQKFFCEYSQSDLIEFKSFIPQMCCTLWYINAALFFKNYHFKALTILKIV